MTASRRVILAGGAGAALASAMDPCARAQEPAEQATSQPPRYEVPGSQVRDIHSTGLSRTYDIFIRLPPAYAAPENSSRRYPVIYLNDAHYCFQVACGVSYLPMAFGGFERAIIVAVSAARGDDAQTSRNRDYTPTPSEGRGYSRASTGGAAAYLEFFKTELIPFVDGQYRTDPARRILSGQSFGGLFGVFALLREPGLFSDYILTSSSLWYDSAFVVREEQRLSSLGGSLSGRVYFAAGETEGPPHWRTVDIASDQTRFAATLRGRGHRQLEVRDEILPGGTHLTTFPIGLIKGLMWLYPGSAPYDG